MKIVVGVDDSPHSRAALEFMKDIAWPAGSRAIVVCAVRPAVALYSEVYAPPVPQVEGVMEEEMKACQTLVSRVERQLAESGLPAEARVVQGDPREALVEVVKAEHADLLVVGSHGRTGLAKLVMGSVASHVASHAPCTVMVVKMRKSA